MNPEAKFSKKARTDPFPFEDFEALDIQIILLNQGLRDDAIPVGQKPALPLTQRARIMRPDVESRVNNEATHTAFVQRLHDEAEAGEVTSGED